MALIAFFACSLDLRLTDAAGDFGWAEPDEEVHAFANDLERDVRLHLYGRRMWEVMRFWESMPDEDSIMGDYGRVWRGTDKVVYSRTLGSVDTARTALHPRFDADEVRRLVAEADGDVTVGGADLAAAAFADGLVDELQLLLVPVLVGEGPRVLPDGVRTGLRLLGSRTFASGWQHLRYAVG